MKTGFFKIQIPALLLLAALGGCRQQRATSPVDSTTSSNLKKSETPLFCTRDALNTPMVEARKIVDPKSLKLADLKMSENSHNGFYNEGVLSLAYVPEVDFIKFKACPIEPTRAGECVRDEIILQDETAIPHLPQGLLNIEAWPCLDQERSNDDAKACASKAQNPEDKSLCFCGEKTTLRFMQRDNRAADAQLRDVLLKQYNLKTAYEDLGNEYVQTLQSSLSSSTPSSGLQLAQGETSPQDSQAVVIKQILAGYGPRFLGVMLRDSYGEVKAYLEALKSGQISEEGLNLAGSDDGDFCVDAREGDAETAAPSIPAGSGASIDAGSIVNQVAEKFASEDAFVGGGPLGENQVVESSNARQDPNLQSGGYEMENIPSKDVLLGVGIPFLLLGSFFFANGVAFYMGKGIPIGDSKLFWWAKNPYYETLGKIAGNLEMGAHGELTVKGADGLFQELKARTQLISWAYNVHYEHNIPWGEYQAMLDDLSRKVEGSDFKIEITEEEIKDAKKYRSKKFTIDEKLKLEAANKKVTLYEHIHPVYEAYQEAIKDGGTATPKKIKKALRKYVVRDAVWDSASSKPKIPELEQSEKIRSETSDFRFDRKYGKGGGIRQMIGGFGMVFIGAVFVSWSQKYYSLANTADTQAYDKIEKTLLALTAEEEALQKAQADIEARLSKTAHE